MTDRRVKVLHIHTLPVVSGSGINTFLSMRGQKNAGLDVELACADGGMLLDWVEKEGMTVRRLKHMVWAVNLIQDLLVVFELNRLIRKQRYDIIHTHNSKAGFVGRLAARLSQVPVVIHTVHGFAFHSAERPFKQWLYRHLERMAGSWCDCFIAISQPLADWAVKEGIAKPGQMVKIYSGIDVEAFHQPADPALRAGLGIASEAFVIGEIAKLWEGKGHAVLLEAAARLHAAIPSLRVLIVGEGNLRQDLEQLATRLGIRDRVIFTGFREDIPAITRALDVAVLPSFFEGMGRAVLEAQAAGKPVVASRVGGIPDLIEDASTGWLVNPGKPDELAAAIQRLYEQPALRQSVGEKARQSVTERFSDKRMSQQILELYDRLLQAKSGRSIYRREACNPRC